MANRLYSSLDESRGSSQWRNRGMLLNAVLTLAWSDKLGVPRLC